MVLQVYTKIQPTMEHPTPSTTSASSPSCSPLPPPSTCPPPPTWTRTSWEGCWRYKLRCFPSYSSSSKILFCSLTICCASNNYTFICLLTSQFILKGYLEHETDHCFVTWDCDPQKGSHILLRSTAKYVKFFSFNEEEEGTAPNSKILSRPVWNLSQFFLKLWVWRWPNTNAPRQYWQRLQFPFLWNYTSQCRQGGNFSGKKVGLSFHKSSSTSVNFSMYTMSNKQCPTIDGNRGMYLVENFTWQGLRLRWGRSGSRQTSPLPSQRPPQGCTYKMQMPSHQGLYICGTIYNIIAPRNTLR